MTRKNTVAQFALGLAFVPLRLGSGRESQDAFILFASCNFWTLRGRGKWLGPTPIGSKSSLSKRLGLLSRFRHFEPL